MRVVLRSIVPEKEKELMYKRRTSIQRISSNLHHIRLHNRPSTDSFNSTHQPRPVYMSSAASTLRFVLSYITNPNRKTLHREEFDYFLRLQSEIEAAEHQERSVTHNQKHRKAGSGTPGRKPNEHSSSPSSMMDQFSASSATSPLTSAPSSPSKTSKTATTTSTIIIDSPRPTEVPNLKKRKHDENDMSGPPSKKTDVGQVKSVLGESKDVQGNCGESALSATLCLAGGPSSAAGCETTQAADLKHSVQIGQDNDLEEVASVFLQHGQELQILPSSNIHEEQLAPRNSASTDCDSDVVSESPMETTWNETLDKENGIQDGTACTLGNMTTATAAQKENDCIYDYSTVAQILSSADGADALDKQVNLQQWPVLNDAMKTNVSETEDPAFASPEEQPQHGIHPPEDNAEVKLDAASKLQKVNEVLQGEIEVLRVENSALEEQNAAWEKKNLALEEKNVTLVKKRADLEKKIVVLEDKNAGLKEKNGGLIEAVGNVKKYKENFGLQETIVGLQKDFAGFRKENLEQREKSFVAEREAWKEVDSLRKELRELNKENIETSKEVISLKEEIFQLRVTTGDLQGSVEVLQEEEEECRRAGTMVDI